MNKFITDEDISKAIRWRLSKFGEHETGQLVGRVISDNGGIEGLCGNRPDLGWTTVCAIAALAAERLSDTSLFYRCGIEVVFGFRKSMHAMCRSDSLSEFIVNHLVDIPGIQAATLWGECIRQANDSDSRTIEGYDSGKREITYRMGRPINYEAFYARFNRLKKKLMNGT